MPGCYRTISLGIIILVALPVALSNHALAQNAGNGGQANVTVTLMPYNPPITLPDDGGTFDYRFEVAHGEATSLTFDAWTIYSLPGGGNEIGYGPVQLSLPGGWSAQNDLSQVISGGLPAGIYTYTAYAGIYPGVIWGSDDFEFEKLTGTIGWYAQSPGAEHGLNAVSFVDTDIGWAVSDYQEILHSTNGGDVWMQQDDGQIYPHEYRDLQFIDAEEGWVVGDGFSLGGTILHTTDAGMTWLEQQPDRGLAFNGVYFVDGDNGWVVGGDPTTFPSTPRRSIEHTSDGGATWHEQLYQIDEFPAHAVHFADLNNGWVVGRTGDILHTTNGGQSWYEQSSGTSNDLNSVFFIDATTGWCVGDLGTIRHSTDGGATWQPQSPGTAAYLNSVYFVDAADGWAAGVEYIGSNEHRPAILHTSDGGASWQMQETGTGADEITLNDIQFVDLNHGWVAGSLWFDQSALLHTENGGAGQTTGVGTSVPVKAPSRPSVAAPAPNPFDRSARIRFSVPEGAPQAVGIDVYDVRGRLIRSLVDGIRAPGEQFVEWDGRTESGQPATNGVYFYEVTIGDSRWSGKLTLQR